MKVISKSELIKDRYYWVRGLCRDKAEWEVCRWWSPWIYRQDGDYQWWIIGPEYGYDHADDLEVYGPLEPPLE